MKRTAVYPGSFDPFTNGHLDIVKKAADLFDHVYVVIGINANKGRTYGSDEMRRAIEKTVTDLGLDNVVVRVHNGLLADFAKDNGIGYMIRGLRNNMDYNYEENIAVVNKLIFPELEYVYFRAENIAVSSSMVRELRSFGRDVSPYVPPAVLDIIQRDRTSPRG